MLAKRSAIPIILIGVALYLMAALYSEYWLGPLTNHPIGEDFRIYFKAYEKAISGQNPYIPHVIGVTFVNHPFVLTLLNLFAWHRHIGVATFTWIAASAVTWLLVGGFFLVEMNRDSKRLPLVGQTGVILVLAILLAFAPLWETLHIGQINIFVLISLILMFYFSESERSYTAGFFFALAIVLKTSPLIFGFYFLALRQFRLLATALVFLLLFTILSILQFGPEVLVNYLSVLGRIGSELHFSTYNQSNLILVAAIFRWLGLQTLEPLLLLGYRLILIIIVALLTVTGFKIPTEAHSLRLMLFYAFLCVMVIFSPLVWYHHFIFLVLPLVYLLIKGSRPVLLTALVLLVVIQSERVFENLVTRYPLPVNMAQIVLLGLVIWLYFSSWRQQVWKNGRAVL